MKVEIDLPENLDPNEFLLSARRVSDDMLSRRHYRLGFEKILVDDQAMEECAQKIGCPLVRRHVYKETSLSFLQEVFGSSDCASQNRPVRMRGSRVVRSARYYNKSEYAKRLASRFLRFVKFTASTYEKIDKMESWIKRRLRLKGIYFYSTVRFVAVTKEGDKWVNGEIVYKPSPITELSEADEALEQWRDKRASALEAWRAGPNAMKEWNAHHVVSKHPLPKPKPKQEAMAKLPKKLRGRAALQILEQLGIQL